jgi:hypothetical protein
MDLRDLLVGFLFTTIAIIFALQTYPMVHNAVFSMVGNTTPLSTFETSMLTLLTLIYPAAIALIPVGLLYKMTEH